MSQARVSYVKSSRKEGKCEKCKTVLPPKSAYRYFYVGFRSTWKHVRCMESACNPKMSELESSKLGQVYAAMEDAEDNIRGCTDWDGIKEALDSVAEALRDTASEYEEASMSPNGDVFNTDAEERAQNLESAADSIEEIDHEDECGTTCEACDSGEIDCEDCGGSGDVGEIEPEQCENCNGAGTVTCTECDGSGTVSGGNIEQVIDEVISEMWDVSLDG
jgi:hypothetical protein